jgi:H+/Cl- antiporter ClcA
MTYQGILTATNRALTLAPEAPTGREMIEVRDPVWVRIVLGAIGGLVTFYAVRALVDRRRRDTWVWPFYGLMAGGGALIGAMRGTSWRIKA